MKRLLLYLITQIAFAPHILHTAFKGGLEPIARRHATEYIPHVEKIIHDNMPDSMKDTWRDTTTKQSHIPEPVRAHIHEQVIQTEMARIAQEEQSLRQKQTWQPDWNNQQKTFRYYQGVKLSPQEKKSTRPKSKNINNNVTTDLTQQEPKAGKIGSQKKSIKQVTAGRTKSHKDIPFEGDILFKGDIPFQRKTVVEEWDNRSEPEVSDSQSKQQLLDQDVQHLIEQEAYTEPYNREAIDLQSKVEKEADSLQDIEINDLDKATKKIQSRWRAISTARKNHKEQEAQKRKIAQEKAEAAQQDKEHAQARQRLEQEVRESMEQQFKKYSREQHDYFEEFNNQSLQLLGQDNNEEENEPEEQEEENDTVQDSDEENDSFMHDDTEEIYQQIYNNQRTSKKTTYKGPRRAKKQARNNIATRKIRNIPQNFIQQRSSSQPIYSNQLSPALPQDTSVDTIDMVTHNYQRALSLLAQEQSETFVSADGQSVIHEIHKEVTLTFNNIHKAITKTILPRTSPQVAEQIQDRFFELTREISQKAQQEVQEFLDEKHTALEKVSELLREQETRVQEASSPSAIEKESILLSALKQEATTVREGLKNYAKNFFRKIIHQLAKALKQLILTLLGLGDYADDKKNILKLLGLDKAILEKLGASKEDDKDSDKAKDNKDKKDEDSSKDLTDSIVLKLFPKIDHKTNIQDLMKHIESKAAESSQQSIIDSIKGL